MRPSLRRQLLTGGARTADATMARPPELSWHDTAVYLLHVAAEIEHALMVQYLYAAYSVGGPSVSGELHELVRAWREVILGIAKEEMGHLITVQNVLRVIGGPLHLEREDYPFRSDFYPFHFRLEPLTKNSLAKYVVAESPEGWSDTPEAKEIVERAQKADNHRPVVSVGTLYRTIIKLFRDSKALPDDAFLDTTAPYQASWDEWARGYGSGNRGNMGGESPPSTPDVLVIPVRDRRSSVDALQQIARQGEAPDPAMGRAEREQSHFARFLKIYEAFPERSPSRRVPANPTTNPEGGGSGVTACAAITNPTSLLWAHLFNVRYRKLLYTLKHAFFVQAGTDVRQPTARGNLIAWTFGEMYNLRTIGGILVTLPLREDGGRALAGPPFEVPYTLSLPDWDSDKWRVQRDILDGAGHLLDQLQDAALPEHAAYLDALRNHDANERTIVELLLETAASQEAAS